MTLTPQSIRLDLKCGKGSISTGEKCHKGSATRVSTQATSSISQQRAAAKLSGKPTINKGLVIGAVAYGTLTAASLYQIKNIRQAYSQKFDPAQRYTPYTNKIGDPASVLKEMKKTNKTGAASLFGDVSFGLYKGREVVAKKLGEKGIAGKMQVNMMEAQGVVSAQTATALKKSQDALQTNEVQAAYLAGNLGFGPKLIAAGDNTLITEVAKGRPLISQDRLLRNVEKLQQELAENPAKAQRKLIAIRWKNFTKGTELSNSNKSRVVENMAKMHTAGISHNDLHPGNIFISKTGAQFIDFGTSERGGGSVSAEFVRMMNPPRFGLQQGGGMGYNLRSVDPEGYSATEKRLKAVIGKRVGKLTSADIYKAVEKSTDKTKLEKDLQSIVDDFYTQYSRRSRSDSAFNNIMSITPSTFRRDLKCGKSSISSSKKCHKGTSLTKRQIAGAAALTLGAGALTAYALTHGRRSTAAASPKPPSAGPTAAPPSPKPTGPTNSPGSQESFSLLSLARPPKSKTQRMRENTAAQAGVARRKIAQTAREEVRRIGQIGNAMAETGEAAGMAAKTTAREVRLRTEAARRRFEPGYRKSPTAAPTPQANPSPPRPSSSLEEVTKMSTNELREWLTSDPSSGQPRRRRDTGLISFAHPVYVDPAR